MGSTGRIFRIGVGWYTLEYREKTGNRFEVWGLRFEIGIAVGK
jgi:hypothetical protein